MYSGFGLPLGISSPACGQLLDEPDKVSIADSLGGLDLIHPAVEGRPAYAVGLVDGISGAAICSETVPALERLADGPIIGGGAGSGRHQDPARGLERLEP